MLALRVPVFHIYQLKLHLLLIYYARLLLLFFYYYLEGGESVLFIIFFSEILKDKPGRAEAAREEEVEVGEMGQLGDKDGGQKKTWNQLLGPYGIAPKTKRGGVK